MQVSEVGASSKLWCRRLGVIIRGPSTPASSFRHIAIGYSPNFLGGRCSSAYCWPKKTHHGLSGWFLVFFAFVRELAVNGKEICLGNNPQRLADICSKRDAAAGPNMDNVQILLGNWAGGA